MSIEKNWKGLFGLLEEIQEEDLYVADRVKPRFSERQGSGFVERR